MYTCALHRCRTASTRQTVHVNHVAETGAMSYCWGRKWRRVPSHPFLFFSCQMAREIYYQCSPSVQSKSTKGRPNWVPICTAWRAMYAAETPAIAAGRGARGSGKWVCKASFLISKLLWWFQLFLSPHAFSISWLWSHPRKQDGRRCDTLTVSGAGLFACCLPGCCATAHPNRVREREENMIWSKKKHPEYFFSGLYKNPTIYIFLSVVHSFLNHHNFFFWTIYIYIAKKNGTQLLSGALV